MQNADKMIFFENAFFSTKIFSFEKNRPFSKVGNIRQYNIDRI